MIANEFTEATNDFHVSALMAVGAVLFVVTHRRQRHRAVARVATAARGGDGMTARR